MSPEFRTGPLGTVYRNLELLSRLGVIRKIKLGGAQKRFDAEVSEHWHVRCVRCGRVEDVDEQKVLGVREALDAFCGRDGVRGPGPGGGGPLADGLREGGGEGVAAGGGFGRPVTRGPVESLSDYEIIGHQIEFVGICPRCGGRSEKVRETGCNEKQA